MSYSYKTETITLEVTVRINYDPTRPESRKEAIKRAKECVLSCSILGSTGSIPKKAKLIRK